MRIEPFDGYGPKARREFWAQVAKAVSMQEKKAGRNVSVQEYPGKGTVINVTRERGIGGGGASDCCQMLLTFHDVVLDCGCITQSDTTSTEIIDDDFFNENPLTICIGNCLDDTMDVCTAFTNRGDSCDCGNEGFDHHFYHEKEWSGSSTCEGDPSFELDVGACHFAEAPIVVLQQVDGLWQLVVRSWNGAMLLFYGTASAQTGPFTNQLLDCSSFPDVPDFCWPFSFSPAWIGAHSGTATAETTTTQCGACCYDTSCTASTEAICFGKSGTYQGNGVLCSPNPCL